MWYEDEKTNDNKQILLIALPPGFKQGAKIETRAQRSSFASKKNQFFQLAQPTVLAAASPLTSISASGLHQIFITAVLSQKIHERPAFPGRTISGQVLLCLGSFWSCPSQCQGKTLSNLWICQTVALPDRALA